VKTGFNTETYWYQ